MTETSEIRLKRLRLRSWRRGMKEMDLILGRFADAQLASLDPATLDTYDALLGENDQDLYRWVSGQEPPPERFAPLLARIEASVREADSV
ncbi:antitoxin CptB [Palleronia aestuarii]|uniref:FAD assembly factor SdhE n=1 Tax=Palleronia aestuarii TaxID=568105 RepID=A0A2W7NNW0_9RHOB|nr:succinate dehydrogenase assembly factor 2 [Palleronia aestuarii]PZX18284.1 antitoxin CptB [Palleronia aestuarii]